ncbi:substrate-binding domain-containing protein [Testudinibacter aquarius]|uniref:Monosaccharide ABC transporter substrate-binding protein (CUT2 family) n=1 Tax=Testudinibacter aquarius TaxID=1524974 RepID=A0A4V2W2N9_9PAST|nr:substrate-binding domain-containing protein [Testudinibacter aquarius]KAE9528333.1 LacI family transcriptional regulator [Testudinibacter aquarius]TCV88829.1 monosaccharide ABC transporter substrate-binding protein (CUT2 family) [Testudinibacter aquarius]TNG86424.1 sugar ABC transporter substrate-binding protein [Testudinibacter aquarius]
MKKLLSGLVFSAFAMGSLNTVIASELSDFQNQKFKIAHVRYLSQGDFPEQYLNGVKKQSQSLGMKLDVYDARQDAALQRNQLEQVIMKGYDGIILQHGFTDSLKDLAEIAVKNGIKVVAFDVNAENPNIPQINQDDHEIARLSLSQAVKDNGDSWKVAYVYVPGIPPLDRRDEVFAKFKEKYPNIKEIARFGTMNNPIPNQVADQAAAVFRANPDITVAFSPYDEFAKGIKIAVDEAGLGNKVRIYSADISNSDIQAMREPNSAWVATVATNPAIMGEVSVRALAKLLKGEFVEAQVTVPPVLITQEILNKSNIKNINELIEKIPEFKSSDVLLEDWMISSN